MNKLQSIVQIIGINGGGERVCASAAKISTTKGDALEIFSKADDMEKNRRLISKVMGSGHRSLIEHIVFNIAFCNVSAVVEQFMIEFRLASFTVKSRRYVDFSDASYYVPEGLMPDLQNKYTEHMDYLFSEYANLLENGIPKEDARFVLPYCFYSNFYCTLNARELIHILERMAHTPDNKELKSIREQLTEQLKDICPSVYDCVVEQTSDATISTCNIESSQEECNCVDDCENVELIQYPSNPLKLLAVAGVNTANKLREIINGSRPRELEHLTYTFKLKNLTLPGITHMARHRMQSISVPSLLSVNHQRYIVPESIKQNPELHQRYKDAFEVNAKVAQSFIDNGANDVLAYFCLSGNTLDVVSTMNARELLLFFKLRTCNRAQWEIRQLATNLLFKLRAVSGEVFGNMGPGCFCTGVCPEGKLSCGKIREISEAFK